LSLVSPFAVVSGVPHVDDKTVSGTGSIVATNEHAARALNQPVLYGEFFRSKDDKSAVAVIGKTVAEQLFKENVPLGRSFDLRGQRVTVTGVFQEFEASPLTPGVDYNNAIFIPYGFAEQFAGGSLQPFQVLARPKPNVSPAQAADELTA